MKSHPITKVIVVTKENESNLKLIKENFPELSNWKPDLNVDFSYTQFLKDKTYLIILNSSKTDISNLLQNVKIEP